VSREIPFGRRKGGKQLQPRRDPGPDLSRHLLRAQEQERRRISRELHDETGQGLMVLRLYLGGLASQGRNPKLRKQVQQATELLDRTISDLRRIIAHLSPRVLDELGLLSAIRKQAREVSQSTGSKAHLYLPSSLSNVDLDLQVALYRTVQEALHNIAKHSHARNFSLRLEQYEGEIYLSVEDDGTGFLRGGGTRSFGLAGMRERIAGLGGTVRIRSRKDRGTRLRVMLPLATGASQGKREDRKHPISLVHREAKAS